MAHPLVLPMLIQMILTMTILYWLAFSRISAIKKAGGIAGLRKAGGFSQRIVNTGDNFKNQFETPVIFYVICLLVIVAGTATTPIIVAAWIYVASRIVHALIQLTNNKIFPNRFLVFLVGSLSLTFIIICAVLQALSLGAA